MAKRKKTARTTQRHRALDVLFEADERGLLDGDDLRVLLSERREVSTAQVPIGDFGAEIVETVAENGDNIDTMIEAASEGWALDRMNAVDRSILRGGSAELMFMGTPRSAVVTEWASLAREFSTDKSVGFVMGVLNRVDDLRRREPGLAPVGGGRSAGAADTREHSAEDALLAAARNGDVEIVSSDKEAGDTAEADHE